MNITKQLNALAPTLGPKKKLLASYLIEHMRDIINMSITELSEAAQVSEGSIISLCRELNLSGFPQLKNAIAQEMVKPIEFIHEDLEQYDSANAIMRKTFHSGVEALLDTLTVLDEKSLEAAKKIITEADEVLIYGIGSASPIAEDAHYRLLRIGIKCKVVIDSHIQLVTAVSANENTAILTISHSGSTTETLTATKVAKERGAKVVCITNVGKSPIQKYTDVILHTMAKETKYRSEALTSRIAQLAVLDSLIACIALENLDESVRHLQQSFDIITARRR